MQQTSFNQFALHINRVGKANGVLKKSRKTENVSFIVLFYLV